MKLPFILLLLIILTFFTCTNDDQSPENVNPKCKVTSIHNQYFEYDEQGRVSKYSSPVENIDYFFDYLANEITITENNKIIKRMEVDSNSRITALLRKNPSNNSFEIQRTYKYDAKGKLTSASEVEDQIVYTLTFDANGNIEKINSGLNYVAELKYDNLSNPLNNDALKSLFVYGLRGAPTNHFFQSLSENNLIWAQEIDGINKQTHTYDYSLNSNGLPAVVDYSIIENNYNSTYSVSYLCH